MDESICPLVVLAKGRNLDVTAPAGSEFSINLSKYGFRNCLAFKGELVEEFRGTGSDLVFLLDENHAFKDGILESLHNAEVLVNSDVVDFVGVEGSSGGISELADSLAFGLPSTSFPCIATRLREKATTDKELLDLGLCFSLILHIRFPSLSIYGIEDPEAHRKAGLAIDAARTDSHKQMAGILLDSFVKEVHKKRQQGHDVSLTPDQKDHLAKDVLSRSIAATSERLKRDVQGSRPEHFVTNYLKYKADSNSRKPGILNAGRLDQDRVVEVLRQRGDLSFIRLRPSAFPDIYSLPNVLQSQVADVIGKHFGHR